MAITLVASDAKVDADSANNGLAFLTLDSTEGNFQVVYTTHRSSTRVPSIDGDGWSTPVLIETEIGTANSRRAVALWWRVVPATQSTTIQAGWTTDPGAVASMGFEFTTDTSGGTWSKDNHAATDNGTTAGTSLASGSAAPASAEAVTIYGLCARSGDVAAEATYDNSFTTGPAKNEGTGGNALSGFSGYRIASGTNTTTASWTTSALATGLIAAFSVSSGAGTQDITPAAVTVNATPGTLSVAPGTVDITPAAVTVQATPGALSVALSVALDAPTVTATPGAVTLAPGAVDITPDPVTVTIAPGTLSVSAGAGTQDITPGAVTVTATPGSLSLAIDIVPDPVTVTATPGSLTVTSGAIDITPEPVSITASPGSLTVTTGVVDITPTPVTITATPGTVTVTAGGLVLDAPTVTATPGTLTLTTGAVDITPDPTTVTATPGTLDVGLAVEVDGPTVTATPGTLTVAVGATSITPEPVTVTVAPGVMVLTGGQTADLNPIKLSFREPSRHLTRTEAAHVVGRESRHVTYQEG